MTIQKKYFIYKLLTFFIIFFIPYTSFPFSFTSSLVSPLASIPIFLLFFLIILNNDSLSIPKLGTLFYFFIGITFFIGIILIFIYSNTQINYILRLKQYFISIITLFLAFISYFIGTFIGKHLFERKKFLNIVIISFILPSFFGILEIINIYILNHKLDNLILNIQSYFSNGDKLLNRIRLLTLEPSWAGETLVYFYLPIFAAYLFYSNKNRKKIFLFFSLTNILILFTKSASAIASMTLIFIYLLIIKNKKTLYLLLSNTKTIIILFLIIILLLSITNVNINYYKNRFISIYNTIISSNSDIDGSAFARSSYWIGGIKTFLNYPILGVGWGNVGFYFEKYIPKNRVIGEVAAYLKNDNIVPNTKSLFIRIISETGIIGFSIFITFLINIYLNANKNLKNNNKKIISIMIILTIITLLVEGFATDSFALIYPWINFGLFSGVNMN